MSHRMPQNRPTRHPGAALLNQYRHRFFWATLLLLLLGTVKLQYLTFDSDFKDFFSADNPRLIAFDALEDNFTSLDNLMILATPPSGSVFEQQHLQALIDLYEIANQTPNALRTESIVNFPFSFAFDGELQVLSLAHPQQHNLDTLLPQIKQQALSNPQTFNRLVSHDERLAAINIPIQVGHPALTAVIDSTEYLEQQSAAFVASHPGWRIDLFGSLSIRKALLDTSRYDLLHLVPLTMLVGSLMLWAIFGTFSAVIVGLPVIWGALVFTAEVIGWIGIPLNQTSVMAFGLTFVLALADCIHIISSYIGGLQQRLSKEDALQQSLESNLRPIFFTTISTASGFLTLNFCDSPPFQELGSIAAVGICLALFCTIFILPYLLVKLPFNVEDRHQHLSTPLLEKIYRIVIRDYQKIAWISTFFIVVVSYFALQNRYQNDPVDYFGPGSSVYAAASHAAEHFDGYGALYFQLDTQVENGINQPQNMVQIAQFAEWLKQQPEVTSVHSYYDLLRRIHQNLNHDNPGFYRLPDDEQTASDYLMLYEFSLQYGQDLNEQLSLDRSAMRLTAATRKLDNQTLLALEQRIQQWQQQHFDGIQLTVSGQTLMFASLGKTIGQSMIQGSISALILITVIMLWALQSLRYSLISLLPNVIPGLYIFGLWGLFVGQIDIAAAVTFSISLGVVVDDTVHFLSKYSLARQRGSSAEESIKFAFEQTGHALMTTTIVLVIGLTILSFSTFGPNATIGKMMATTISCALVFDFFLLPALLLIIDKEKDLPQKAPKPTD